MVPMNMDAVRRICCHTTRAERIASRRGRTGGQRQNHMEVLVTSVLEKSTAGNWVRNLDTTTESHGHFMALSGTMPSLSVSCKVPCKQVCVSQLAHLDVTGLLAEDKKYRAASAEHRGDVLRLVSKFGLPLPLSPI